MSKRLSVDFAPAEGAVLRLIGLVERRGFRVTGMAMTEHSGGSSASMELALVAHDAGRSLETLELQLMRLHGVSEVRRAPAQEQEKAA